MATAVTVTPAESEATKLEAEDVTSIPAADAPPPPVPPLDVSPLPPPHATKASVKDNAIKFLNFIIFYLVRNIRLEKVWTNHLRVRCADPIDKSYCAKAR
ncbi:MAG: hypothetical protein K2Q97_15745, partial [Burkholderiaceae bacterium]|nr:hypothetical protein [Burkholderiaceae bacterium]